MKKIITVILMIAMLTSFPIIVRAEEAAEEKVSGEIAASVLSAYIWRGQELTRHSVVVQPSLTAGYKGFTANVWGNLDTNPYSGGDEEYSSNFTETDVTLSYSKKFGLVQAGVGYIYYGLAAAAPAGSDLPDSQEVFFTLVLDTILSPTLTVYKEIDYYKQLYITLGVSHTFALHEKVGLKLAAQASYLKSDDETTYPEFKRELEFDGDTLATADKFNNVHDGVVSISIPIAVTGHLTISPTLTYVFPLSNDAKYEMRARGLEGDSDPSDKKSSFLYGGIVLSYMF
ncbi:MAG: hypothetical protein JW925_06270 [Syntrophaceae bacterium]|nr:hypothetical protein [Syntrophaceae bacterium]